MELNVVEKDVAARIKAKWEHRRMIISRVANLTESINGRGSCQYRNLCMRGCPYGAYFSSQAATLPAAARTGNMTLKHNAVVHSLIM